MFMLKSRHQKEMASKDAALDYKEATIGGLINDIGCLRRQLTISNAELAEMRPEISALRAAKAKRIANLTAANARRAKGAGK